MRLQGSYEVSEFFIDLLCPDIYMLVVVDAEVVRVIPTVTVACRSGEDMTAYGADQEFPEIKVGIRRFAELWGLFALSIYDLLHGIEGLLVDECFVLSLDILSGFVFRRRNVDQSNVELIYASFPADYF